MQLKVEASVAISICLGPVCGGVQANGFWEAAMGVDMALTTTTGGALGLDADKNGCREWTFESKLTNYAEYPPSDGGSRSIHAKRHTTWSVECRAVTQAWKAIGSSSCQKRAA